ncbi:hypothetical protein CJP74_02415 [Psittacicella melopsittaci]|uniref:Ancillary SecYEG translocon subunit n=1 Tax=Psittacicella melopsittaci TaxID=2028576 RepID=A0A3A1Y7U4_9GAMM|nr:tetratricopeptide repeat protein [Psittacicella melopsittaci]RIY33299.1 hypothetical protein CJP74_02415 [Psittacicella melopsittaci]
MAYTTEEQDFQSFMSKLRQYLPFIILAVAIGVTIYFGINWFKNNQVRQQQAEYQEYQQIMTIPNQGDDVTTRNNMLLQYIEKNPKKALAALGLLDQAKYLADQGQYTQALQLVEAIPSNNEFSPELVAITKAKLLLQLGRGEEGIPALDAISQGSWYVSARLLAGDIYFSDGKYQQAYNEYQVAQNYLNQELANANANTTDIESLNSQVQFLQLRMNIAQSYVKNLETPAAPAAPAETTAPAEPTAPASESNN